MRTETNERGTIFATFPLHSASWDAWTERRPPHRDHHVPGALFTLGEPSAVGIRTLISYSRYETGMTYERR